MAAPQIALPRFDDTLGAALIGVFIAAIFYGVTCVQTYIYLSEYKKDNLLLKGSVCFLWVLDTLHLIFVTHLFYHFCVTNFANPEALLFPPWTIPAEVIATVTNDVMIRMIFAYRVWNLSGNRYLIMLIVTLSLLVYGGGIACGVVIARFKTFADFHVMTWLIYFEYTSVATVDVLIAASMCYLLNNLRTGFRRSEFQIQSLMIYSIHTGALTSIVAIGCLICYGTMPHNFIWISIFFILPKLFLNSLLATLNVRRYLKEYGSDAGLQSIRLSEMANSAGGTTHPNGADKSHNVERIQVFKSVEALYDIKV